MSRTRGHNNATVIGHAGKEVWSGRCHLVNMWSMNGRSRELKRITAKYERRRDRAEIESQLWDISDCCCYCCPQCGICRMDPDVCISSRSA